MYLTVLLALWAMLRFKVIPSPLYTEIRYKYKFFVNYEIYCFEKVVFSAFHDMREWEDGSLIATIYFLDKYIIPMNIRIK